MNFKTLSNDQLIASFENAVRTERKITGQVLDCIGEIDRRRLYLEKGFTSLFDFLVKDFGYSPGAAMRQIDAARLLCELPEVAQKFQEGSLTLSQANQVQRASRELKKIKREILSTESKRELILQIENSTQKQTEQIISTTLNLPLIPVQKEIFHRDQSVTLTITFTQEQMQVLEQVQNMISHSVANKDWAAALTYLAQKELKRRTTVRRASDTHKVVTSSDTTGKALKRTDSLAVTPKTTGIKTQDKVFSTAATAVKPTDFVALRKRRTLPAAIRKGLLHEDASCAYKNRNGKPCASQRFLQIDHIHSWSRGGVNDPANLQVLCGVHNRLKFRNE